MRKHDRRKIWALHFDEVVVETNFARFKQRRHAQCRRDSDYECGTLQPNIFDARARHVFGCSAVNDVLSSAQEHRGQHRHHRNETNEQTAAADDAHFLDAFEIRQPHRQKRARRRQRANENSLAGENHRFC